MERKWWTLLASCIAIFMLLLDVTIVNVALPSIERSLGANFTDLQWVIDAYALTLAGVLLAAGSLADKVGRRLVFMLGLAIFTASSLACGLAPDPLFLQVSRAAQGIGGAMMFGTSLALIAQEFQGRERGTALGIWGATTALAVSTGPLVGGALVDALSWRWIFLVNVPIGVAGLVVARLRLRESRDPAASGVDLRGVALLCPALFLFVYALIRGNEEGWGSALIISCFAVSALLLVLFVVVERRAADPLLDLSLFRKPAFTGVTIAGFALSASIFSMFLYITLFFQNVLGYSPLAGGAPIAAGHHADPVRLAAERPADGTRAGAAAARDGARVRDRRAAADGEPVRLVGVDRAAARPDPGRHRDRPGHPRAGLDRRRRGRPAAERHGVGREQHGPPTRARHRNRRASARSSNRRSSRRSPRWSRARPRRRTSTSLRGLWRPAGPGAPCRRCRPPTATRSPHAAHHAFVTGFNTIAMVSVAVAAVGSVAGYALVRSRDFVGGPAAAPAEPSPAEARAQADGEPSVS